MTSEKKDAFIKRDYKYVILCICVGCVAFGVGYLIGFNTAVDLGFKIFEKVVNVDSSRLLGWKDLIVQLR